MPKHMLKLLVLLTGLSVAPASAGQSSAPPSASQNDSGCPYERGEIAATAAWTAAPKGETRITLTDRVPADSALFTRPGSRFVTP